MNTAVPEIPPRRILSRVICHAVLALLAALQMPAYAQRYVDPIFPTVHISRDIPFGEAMGYSDQIETLLLDVYEPEGDTEVNRPAVLLIHGGGFTGGYKALGLYEEMATEFALRGYVAFSINYRLAKRLDSPAVVDTAVADATTALNWIRRNHAEYGVDPNKISIGGDSAGGAIVVHLCYRDPASVGAIACLNLWGGMYEFGKTGGSFSAPIYPEPIEPGTPPTLLIHGTADTVVPLQTSLDLADQLAAAGVHHELYTLPEAGHYPISLAGEFIPVMVDFVYRMMNASEDPASTVVAEEMESISAIPALYALDQNYPNPFNSSTMIRFSLPTSEAVELAVYNLAGQKVAILASGSRPAGTHIVRWDGRDAGGRDLASGAFLYRLQAGARVETRKLLLLQ